MENTHQERLSSRNLQTEVHMVGESCPSEMSSFQRTISYSKESKGVSEVQSQERGLRKSNKRESQISSSEYSIGSPSYENIHNNQGCGDQEVVIPVRISSRIRNQVPKSKNDFEYESETIADQSLPPYDPITNYLASRPRLLYYNPNQRIERIHSRECMGLEECFTSESLSDTETSEETQ